MGIFTTLDKIINHLPLSHGSLATFEFTQDTMETS